MSFPRATRKSLAAALAASALSALAITWAGPAEARMGFGGGMRGFGGVHGGMHSFGGFHGAAFAPRFAARPMMFRQAAFAPHFANRPFVHRAAFVNRPFFHRRRHFGAAFAAGLIGATAVGLASSAYAYPYDGYGYYPASYGYGDGCYVVRRRHVNPWGYVVVRRQLICD